MPVAPKAAERSGRPEGRGRPEGGARPEARVVPEAQVRPDVRVAPDGRRAPMSFEPTQSNAPRSRLGTAEVGRRAETSSAFSGAPRRSIEARMSERSRQETGKLEKSNQDSVRATESARLQPELGRRSAKEMFEASKARSGLERGTGTESSRAGGRGREFGMVESRGPTEGRSRVDIFAGGKGEPIGGKRSTADVRNMQGEFAKAETTLGDRKANSASKGQDAVQRIEARRIESPSNERRGAESTSARSEFGLAERTSNRKGAEKGGAIEKATTERKAEESRRESNPRLSDGRRTDGIQKAENSSSSGKDSRSGEFASRGNDAIQRIEARKKGDVRTGPDARMVEAKTSDRTYAEKKSIEVSRNDRNSNGPERRVREGNTGNEARGKSREGKDTIRRISERRLASESVANSEVGGGRKGFEASRREGSGAREGISERRSNLAERKSPETEGRDIHGHGLLHTSNSRRAEFETSSPNAVQSPENSGILQTRYAYHYTSKKDARKIMEEGFRMGWATPIGDLSQAQAQIELSIDPFKPAPEVKIRIDLEGLRKAGFEIPRIKRIASAVEGKDGRMYQMPGGGYEMKFEQEIPKEFLEEMPIQ